MTNQKHRNPYQSGIVAKTVILPGREDAAAFEALKAEYHDFHQPRTPAARRMCDQLALHEWFDHRLAKLQVALFEHEFQTTGDLNEDCALGQAYSNASAKFARLEHSLAANNRTYLQCLDKLEDIEDRYPADPEPIKPDFPTSQPAETKSGIEQLASFPKNAASEASHLPQPPAPSPQPREHSEQHPPLDACPNCRNLGYISPNCRYVLRR